MQASTTAPLLVLALLGGAAAGAATAWIAAPAATHGGDAPAAATPASDSTLAARVDELARENRELRDALAALENRPPTEARVPLDGFVARGDFDAFREEVLAALELRSGEEPPSEVLREQVADALTTIRKEERVDEVRKALTKRTERIDRDMEKLDEWLTLTPGQSEGLRASLLAQYERDEEVRRRWEAGEDDEVLGELKRMNGETFRLDVEQVLDADQLETFWTQVVGRGK